MNIFGPFDLTGISIYWHAMHVIYSNFPKIVFPSVLSNLTGTKSPHE